ncbi:MAG: glycosyltransferase family 9 protein [Elusimicrobia bacterium]|nr:glycosyltransferase family 9 protein [Elusimicrobiota bacterium]
MKFQPQTRFLLIRTDKIGDLLLTTPAIQVLKKRYPNSFIAFLCSSYAAALLENNPWIDLIIKTDDKDSNFFETVRKVKKLKFDVAIHFYIEWKSIWITRFANIPLRIGPKSKPASVFLNFPIAQKRSRVEKHEAEYNLDLVKICDAFDSIPPSTPQIFLQETESTKGKENLAKILKNQNKKPIFIHPGSKGSAQNWPLNSFLELAKCIEAQGLNVIVTGGEEEEEFLKTVERCNLPHLHRCPSNLTLREFAALIHEGELMISNSTGPLHMAAALGIPTLSFYPHLPITTSAKRWGPYPPSSKHIILKPKQENDPLFIISVQEAFETTKEILSRIIH